jgi:hypothetical protein
MKVLIRWMFISILIMGSMTQFAIAQAEKNPYGGTAVPAPAPTEVILTVSNASIIKNYSMNDLKKLNPISITIYEPFVRKRQTFLAIPFSRFATDAKIPKKAKLSTIALNDYIYSNTLSNFVKAKGHIAIALAGKPISYDQGGPIRIIFPTDSVWAKNLDPWNWSLRRILVK